MKMSPLPYDIAATAKSLQSCLNLCDPIDSSPPGSPVPGILQASLSMGFSVQGARGGERGVWASGRGDRVWNFQEGNNNFFFSLLFSLNKDYITTVYPA